jgi:hypothetical protein
MRSLWILFFAVQAYAVPVMAVGSGDEGHALLVVVVTNTNSASGVLGVGTNGSGANTPFTTAVPGPGFAGVPPATTTIPPEAGFAAGAPATPVQPIAPANPFGTSNAPTTTLQGETALNNVDTATSTSQGFSTLSPGAGANGGVNGGYAVPAEGANLATAPALPTMPTASNSALAPTGQP